MVDSIGGVVIVLAPLSLWACVPDDELQPVPFEPSPVPTDVPWGFGGSTEGVDLDAVVQAANDTILRIADLDPEPVLEAYRDLAAGADPGCPALFADEDFEYWRDSCVSGTGTRFEGFGLDDLLYVDDGVDGYALAATGGTGRIEDPDGTWLAFDGFAQRADDVLYGMAVSSLSLSGSFATNHPAADGTWVAEGLVPDVSITRWEADGERVAFSVSGSIGGFEGDFPAVAFNDVALSDPAYGGCDLEPSGIVSVRLLSGWWIDIGFDPEIAEDGTLGIADPTACDGCGRASSRTEPLGEVCLDFGSWLFSGG